MTAALTTLPPTGPRPALPGAAAPQGDFAQVLDRVAAAEHRDGPPGRPASPAVRDRADEPAESQVRDRADGRAGVSAAQDRADGRPDAPSADGATTSLADSGDAHPVAGVPTAAAPTSDGPGSVDGTARVPAAEASTAFVVPLPAPVVTPTPVDAPAPALGGPEPVVAPPLASPAPAASAAPTTSTAPAASAAPTAPTGTTVLVAAASAVASDEADRLAAPVPDQRPVTTGAESASPSAPPDRGAATPAPAQVPVASAVAVPASPSAPPSTTTPAPVPLPLAEQLGARLTALTGPVGLSQGRHVLTVPVDPENLGPVRIVAHIGPESVRVELVGATDASREALRGAMSELRRDLAASGLTVDVGTGDGRSDDHEQPDRPRAVPWSEAASPTSEQPLPTTPDRPPSRGLDLFA